MTNRTSTRTAVTDISSSQILLNPAEAGVEVVEGKLYEDMAPGTWVTFDYANAYWIGADADTAAHKLRQCGVVGYRKRVNQTTSGLKIITDNWDISEAEDKRTPIILSGFVIGKIDDQGATVPALTSCMIGSNKGIATIIAQEATGAAGGTAVRAVEIATLADSVIDDDTFAIFGIGSFKNKIWGGS